jgi:hypothetical protein
VIPLFYKPLEKNGFQTPFRKLYKGDVYVSTILWAPLQKIYFFIQDSFQKAQRHDHHGALAQTLSLMMFVA